jgi:xanthine dehydrogenase YagR molybdenum-binding subunit
MLSREREFRAIGGRTTTEQRVAIGARADGRIDALIHTGIAAMTAHNNIPEQVSSGPWILGKRSGARASVAQPKIS